MPKNFSHILHIIVLMLLPWLTGILFLENFGTPSRYPDSSSYFFVEKQLQQGMLMDTTVRTPAYPLFLFVTHRVFGQNDGGIVYAQTLLMGITYVLCYLLLIKLQKKQNRALVITLLLGLNLNVLAFENVVLSETLAIFLVVLFVYLQFLLAEKLSLVRFILNLFVGFSLIMVRPVLVGLPLCLYGFHLSVLAVLWLKARHTKHTKENEGLLKKIVVNVLGFVLICSVIVGYAFNNLVKYNYFGISRVGEIDLLGKLLQYGYLNKLSTFTDPVNAENTLAFEKIKQGYVSAGITNLNPWEVMYRLTWSYSPEAIADIPKLSEFMHNTLKNNWPSYIGYSLALMPKVFSDYPIYYAPLTLREPNYLFSVSVKTMSLLRPVFFCICLFVGLRELLKGDIRLFSMLAILLLTVVYLVFATIFMAYSEYSRILVPVELVMDMIIAFVCCYCWDTRRR
jgi:hypothetical protein